MPVVRRKVVRVKPAPWPGLSDRISTVFNLVLQGRIPSNLADVTIKREKFWHRQQLAAAGQTILTYFNAAYADFVTNLPQPGQLPNEMAFALGRVNVAVESGVLTTGAVDAAGAQIQSQAAGTHPVITMLEQIRITMMAGQLKLKIGDKTLINQKDLSNFPAGHGFSTLGAAIAGTEAATVVNTISPVQNGGPLDNPWAFRPWYPVLPGKQISGTLNWQAALAITNAVVYGVVELEGISVTPSNL